MLKVSMLKINTTLSVVFTSTLILVFIRYPEMAGLSPIFIGFCGAVLFHLFLGVIVPIMFVLCQQFDFKHIVGLIQEHALLKYFIVK